MALAITNNVRTGHSMGQWALFFLALFGLTGCCCAVQGELQKGKYISHSREFSINLPFYNFGERSYRAIKARDRVLGAIEAVDFADYGLWTYKGGYFVEWHRLDPGRRAATYISELETTFSEYAKQNLRGSEKFPTELTIFRSSTEQLGSRPARRWIARGLLDGERAVGVFTVVDYTDRVAVVGMIYPYSGLSPGVRDNLERMVFPEKDFFPLEYYLPFVESLQRLK